MIRSAAKIALKKVALITGISAKDIHSSRRPEEIVRARHLWWFIVKNHCGACSLNQIGRLHTPARDHSGIHHGLRLLEDRLKTDEETRCYYLDCCDLLGVTPVPLPDMPKKRRVLVKLQVKEPPRPSPAPEVKHTWTPDPPVVAKRGKWRDRQLSNLAPEPEPHRVALANW